MLTESYIRELIKQCYGISGSASMQLDSFNNFILFGLQNIIDEDPELVVQIEKILNILLDIVMYLLIHHI